MNHSAIVVMFGLLAAGVAPAAAQLEVDAPTVRIDKTSSNGSAVLYVRNRSGASVTSMLRVQEFRFDGDHLGIDGKATLGPPTTAGRDQYSLTVAAGAAVPVRIDVAGFVEAGPATARLLADGVPIGNITALRSDVPFTVKLDGTPAERPEVTFQSIPRRPWTFAGDFVRSAFGAPSDSQANAGLEPTQVVVRNDDPLTYVVDWKVVVNGVTVAGDRSVTLTRNAQTTIAVTPATAWFRGPTSYLKDDLQDGTLVLRFPPTSMAADRALASKALPLRARLRSGSTLHQTAIGTGLVALLVFLGGLSSLLLRFWVPNRVAGIDVQEQLKAIADRTRSLSSSLDSSVRVLVRVQRHRLVELATSRIPFSPDWGSTLADCTRRIGVLARQLDLLETIDRLAAAVLKFRMDHIAAGPPTLLDEVQARLTMATETLRSAEPKDADLQAAQAAVGDVDALLRTIRKSNPTFETELIGRFTRIQPAAGGIPAGNPTRARLAPLLGLTAALSMPIPVSGTIDVKDYAALDLLALRLDLLVKYVKFFDSRPAAVRAALTVPDGPEARLLKSLDVDGWVWFQDATFVHSQIVQGLFVDDVLVQLRASEIDIVPSPQEASPYEPVRFRAWFRSDLVGRSAGREDITCHWTFLHQSIEWTEDGWEVWHYFPADGSYIVRATFTETRTGARVIANGQPVTLERPFLVRTQRTSWFGARTRLELVRFGIVFGATLLGLLAGAREQLIKLDLVGGIIAVFLLGFSADAIKNLLTGK